MIINNMPGLALGTTNANAATILENYNAYSGDGDEIKGAMANQGAFIKTTSYGGSITIPEGYHNGNGSITGGTVVSYTNLD